MNILNDLYVKLKGTDKGQEAMEKTIKIFDELMKDLKTSHPDYYEKLLNKLYVVANGYHFNQATLDEAYEHMINDDGSKAPKWSLAETTQVAKSNGIVMDKFNEYDWNYVMNMLYSDYREVLGDSVSNYVRMGHKFLKDKDAPDGKAYRYYMAMQEC